MLRIWQNCLCFWETLIGHIYSERLWLYIILSTWVYVGKKHLFSHKDNFGWFKRIVLWRIRYYKIVAARLDVLCCCLAYSEGSHKSHESCLEGPMWMNSEICLPKLSTSFSNGLRISPTIYQLLQKQIVSQWMFESIATRDYNLIKNLWERWSQSNPGNHCPGPNHRHCKLINSFILSGWVWGEFVAHQ